MKFNKLVPELNVSNIQASLDFYVKILKFKIEYQRSESKFAFLSYQGSQIMINQTPNSITSPWYIGKLTYPRGKGIHFQFEVKSIQPLIKNLKAIKYPLKAPPKEYWFRQDNSLLGMNGFLVMDPDGYLLMFNEDLGAKPLA